MRPGVGRGRIRLASARASRWCSRRHRPARGRRPLRGAGRWGRAGLWRGQDGGRPARPPRWARALIDPGHRRVGHGAGKAHHQRHQRARIRRRPRRRAGPRRRGRDRRPPAVGPPPVREGWGGAARGSACGSSVQAGAPRVYSARAQPAGEGLNRPAHAQGVGVEADVRLAVERRARREDGSSSVRAWGRPRMGRVSLGHHPLECDPGDAWSERYGRAAAAAARSPAR